MCGIAGFVGRSAEDGRRVIEAMTDAVAHRGPDGRGYWLGEDAALGHARLAVIDRPGGAQPMVGRDESLVAVFNGEIYNHLDLREELRAAGVEFRTQSDAEVLLEAFRCWGENALPRLRGMFAFAIYEPASKRLFMARDSVGIKPLYYSMAQSAVYFGSEIPGLLAASAVPRRVNPKALVEFLAIGYPLAPETAFAHIKELEPGTWVEFSPGGERSKRYWSWHRTEEPWDMARSLDEAEAALRQSVRDHLVSDVPVGLLLSGGIDSSLLAWLVSSEGGATKAFTVGFRDRDYDESRIACRTARSLGLDHMVIHMEDWKPDLEALGRIIDLFGQPFADSSALPTYLVCREVRKHVKVVLGGDGGDEMFGGYPRFRHADIARALGRLPGPLIEAGRSAVRRLSRWAPDLSRQGDRLLRAATASDRLTALSCYSYSDQLERLAIPLAGTRSGYPVLSESPDPGSPEFIDATVRWALPGDYLRKVDVMSGAHGLEVRVPYLGTQVLSCGVRLPNRLKQGLRHGKIVLRELAKRHLPPGVADAPKRGFGVPFDAWLGDSGRRALRDEVLSCAALSSIVDPGEVQTLLDGFVAGRWDRAERSRLNLYQHAYMLWTLSRWLRRWKPAF